MAVVDFNKLKWFHTIPFFVFGFVILIMGIFNIQKYGTLASDAQTIEGPVVVTRVETINHIRAARMKVPYTVIRDQETEILNSSGHDFAVGQTVTVRYSTSGKPVASFVGGNGGVGMAGVAVPITFGLVLIAAGTTLLIMRAIKTRKP